nr:MAG TPA: hypothetical protein [Caudoviricetes sp.]
MVIPILYQSYLLVRNLVGKSTKKCWNEQINQLKIDLSLPFVFYLR